MTLVVLTVVVIALLVAVLAIFLFAIGALLNRTANNLDDCAQNVKNIAYQADVIGPAIERINTTGTTVIGALPLLCDGAEQIGVAKGAPYVDPDAPRPSRYSAPPAAAPAAAAPVHRAPVPVAAVPEPAPPAAAAPEPSHAAPAAVPAGSQHSVGYLDDASGNYGYLDS
ncbi:MAG: hypothetical protein ACRDRS_06170 [Pseudonocardiaceae bacterium]